MSPKIAKFPSMLSLNLSLLREKLLRDVIKMVLNRDWYFDSEVKDFGFIACENEPETEYISYKGKIIGKIVPRMEQSDSEVTMALDFIPVTISNSAKQ